MGGFSKKIKSKKDTRKRVTIIPRDEWGAQPVKGKVVHLKLPVQFVRYGYTGYIDSCKSKLKCVPFLQEYQQKFIDKGFPDQPFNFLIGGDGLVYEGRGWNLEADRAEKIHRKIKGKAIDIGYIGDFSDSEPFSKMLEAAELLLEFASEENYLQDLPKILNLNDFEPLLEED